MSHSSDQEPLVPFTDSSFVHGVRYSLPDLLAEIRVEKVTGSYAMEKLDQKEIGKLFKPQKRRRAKPAQQ